MKTYYCTVHPRNPDHINPVHEYVNKRNVYLSEKPTVGQRCYIHAVEGSGVHTSLVVSVDNLCDGDIRIVTLNTVYNLVCRGDDDDT